MNPSIRNHTYIDADLTKILELSQFYYHIFSKSKIFFIYHIFHKLGNVN